jgi:hypothetical protein
MTTFVTLELCDSFLRIKIFDPIIYFYNASTFAAIAAPRQRDGLIGLMIRGNQV